MLLPFQRRTLLPLAILVTVLLANGRLASRPALAQAVTGDDIAGVMLDGLDLPGFHLLGDGSPPARAEATNEQRTRVFMADGTGAGDYTLLTEIITVPNEGAICLPYLPDNVASGAVLSLNNADMANFQRADPPAAGDVATAATWSDLDAGANTWINLYELVFMRGRVTVYLIYRTHDASADQARIGAYALRQDEKLRAAIDAGSPLGLQASIPVPPRLVERPEICG